MLSDRVVNTRSLGSNISELGKIGTSNLYCGGAVHCFLCELGGSCLAFRVVGCLTQCPAYLHHPERCALCCKQHRHSSEEHTS